MFYRIIKPSSIAVYCRLSLLKCPSLQHLDLVEDSDYQSMSSQSNSTESLNSLISPRLIPITADSYNFNRAVGKESNSSEDLLTPAAPAVTKKLLPSQISWNTETEHILQAPLADLSSNHHYIFGANCPQLQDFINVPKLSEVYSAKNMIGLEAELNAAVAKISDFIISNKSVVVDLTANRFSGRKDTIKTTDLIDINETKVPTLFLPTSPMSISTSNVAEVTPNSHNTEHDLMTFPETNFFHDTPGRSRNRNSDTEALKTDRVPQKLEPEPIKFAKLNFGSTLTNIFKPKSSSDQNALPQNDEKLSITSKASNQSTQSTNQIQRNPSSTSSLRSSTSTGTTTAFSRISIVSGIGSTCGSSINSNRRTYIAKQPIDSTIPLYGAVVIQGRGMSGIPVWLKSLRLHKYTWVFVDMSYERMLKITESYLEELSITKGARNKLALSIIKLNERFHTMDSIENGLLNGTCVTALALDELTSVVQTPMKPADTSDERDVASKFMRVVNLGKDYFCQ